MHVSFYKLGKKNLRFVIKSGGKTLKRGIEMKCAFGELLKETITVRPIQLSDCSHYVPAFSPVYYAKSFVQRKKMNSMRRSLCFFEKQKNVFQRVLQNIPFENFERQVMATFNRSNRVVRLASCFERSTKIVFGCEKDLQY